MNRLQKMIQKIKIFLGVGYSSPPDFYERSDYFVHTNPLARETYLDQHLEKTELYLRDHRYKTAVFFDEMDLKKNIESSPIPRHPRMYSSKGISGKIRRCR